MRKKLVSILLAGLMVLPLTACGNDSGKKADENSSAASSKAESSTTASSAGAAADSKQTDASDPLAVSVDGKGVKIGFVVKDLSSQYWNLMRVGAEDAAKKYGSKLTFIAPNSESDVQKQVENIETMISAGVDVLCIAPSNDETVLPALQNAVDAGIKVIAVDTNSSLPDKLAFIGTGNKEAAEQGAAWAAEQVGKGKKAIVLRGRLGDQTHDLREEGIKAGLEKGGVEVVETQAADSSEEKALQITENLLQSYPDVALIITTADPMSIGAFNALKYANNTTAKVYGFNGDTPVCELVAQGAQMLGTSAQSPYNMGVLGVQNAIRVAKGETIEKVIDSGSEVISKDNAQAYMDQIAARSGS